MFQCAELLDPNLFAHCRYALCSSSNYRMVLIQPDKAAGRFDASTRGIKAVTRPKKASHMALQLGYVHGNTSDDKRAPLS